MLLCDYVSDYNHGDTCCLRLCQILQSLPQSRICHNESSPHLSLLKDLDRDIYQPVEV